MSDRTNRRNFIKKSLIGAATLTVSGAVSSTNSGCSSWQLKEDEVLDSDIDQGKNQLEIPKPSVISQIKNPAVSSDMTAAVTKLLEPLGGIGAFVKEGQSVLIKPNMGFAHTPDRRTTTSAKLVGVVAKMVRDLGASKILVADNPVNDVNKILKLMGIKEALEGLDAKIVLVDKASNFDFVERKIPQGKAIDSTEVLAEAAECDVHIAMPIAKSHSWAGFTGTLKGMMGLVATRNTFHWLHDLHQSIADLNTVIKADLIIMDAMEVLATEGPKGPGELVRCDTLIAGTDPVAVDSAGVRLTPLFGRRVKPKQVKHIRLAANMGVGHIKLPDDKVHQLEFNV
jgi:uncharacterized protein (DUF362 family)